MEVTIKDNRIIAYGGPDGTQPLTATAVRLKDGNIYPLHNPNREISTTYLKPIPEWEQDDKTTLVSCEVFNHAKQGKILGFRITAVIFTATSDFINPFLEEAEAAKQSVDASKLQFVKKLSQPIPLVVERSPIAPVTTPVFKGRPPAQPMAETRQAPAQRPISAPRPNADDAIIRRLTVPERRPVASYARRTPTAAVKAAPIVTPAVPATKDNLVVSSDAARQVTTPPAKAAGPTVAPVGTTTPGLPAAKPALPETPVIVWKDLKSESVEGYPIISGWAYSPCVAEVTIGADPDERSAFHDYHKSAIRTIEATATARAIKASEQLAHVTQKIFTSLVDGTKQMKGRGASVSIASITEDHQLVTGGIGNNVVLALTLYPYTGMFEAQDLSENHNDDNRDERQRIKGLGLEDGIGPVAHDMSLARAIGFMDDPRVAHEPTILSHDLKREMKNGRRVFIVMGSRNLLKGKYTKIDDIAELLSRQSARDAQSVFKTLAENLEAAGKLKQSADIVVTEVTPENTRGLTLSLVDGHGKERAENAARIFAATTFATQKMIKNAREERKRMPGDNYKYGATFEAGPWREIRAKDGRPTREVYINNKMGDVENGNALFAMLYNGTQYQGIYPEADTKDDGSRLFRVAGGEVTQQIETNAIRVVQSVEWNKSLSLSDDNTQQYAPLCTRISAIKEDHAHIVANALTTLGIDNEIDEKNIVGPVIKVKSEHDVLRLKGILGHSVGPVEPQPQVVVEQAPKRSWSIFTNMRRGFRRSASKDVA